MTYLWAYLAGILTLINPCVLPLLPIVLATALQASRFGPLALCAGLVLTFVVVGVGVNAFGAALGIDDQLINRIAAVMMVLFGLMLLIPRAQIVLANLFSPVASGANAQIDAQIENKHSARNGMQSQFLIGVMLGAVWSPCIGPTLGGAIGLAASGQGLLHASVTMLVFGVGVSSVMLVLAYGSREVLASRQDRLRKIMPYAKPIMGVALLFVGLMLLFHFERAVEGWLLDVMPIWLQDLSVSI